RPFAWEDSPHIFASEFRQLWQHGFVVGDGLLICSKFIEGGRPLKLFRAFLVMIFAVVLSVSAFSREQQPPPRNQNTQVIDMTAKKYTFTPSPVHVKKGTKVELRITSTDHNHG